LSFKQKLRKDRWIWHTKVKADSAAAHERCTKRSALNASKSAKYHSSRQKASLFSAGTASRSERGTRFFNRYQQIISNPFLPFLYFHPPAVGPPFGHASWVLRAAEGLRRPYIPWNQWDRYGYENVRLQQALSEEELPAVKAKAQQVQEESR
jgi:hypothetical protein